MIKLSLILVLPLSFIFTFSSASAQNKTDYYLEISGLNTKADVKTFALIGFVFVFMHFDVSIF